MANTTIPSELIAADAITGAKIADNAVDSEHYTDGSIDTAHIADSQVTVGKMAANSVDSDQYVDGSIDLIHMSVNSIDSDQYVDGSIDTAHIADAQITVGKMAANSVDSDQYVDGSIDLIHMSVNSIDSDQYVDGSIDTIHIADDAVTGAKIENAVTIATSVTSPLIDGTNFKINGAQGSDGQVLTSTGSGVAWEAAGGGVAGIVSNADATAITIDSSEQILIGTSTSSTGIPLTVYSSDTSQFHIGGAQAGISNNLYFNGSAWVNKVSGNGGGIFQIGTDGTFAFRRATTGASPTLSYSAYIDGSGNVGIGETTPDFSGFGSNGGGLEIDDVGSSFSALRINQGATGDFYVAVSTGAAYLWGKANSPIVFGTNNTERLRLDDTGEFLVNRTDGFGTGGAAAMFVTGRSDAAIYVTGPNTSGYTLMSFHNGGLNQIGSIKNSNNTAVIYATSSDYRLKENVNYTWDATTRLKQLKPARFNWISDEANTTVDGFLAQRSKE
jgi:hypothetical protein